VEEEDESCAESGSGSADEEGMTVTQSDNSCPESADATSVKEFDTVASSAGQQTSLAQAFAAHANASAKSFQSGSSDDCGSGSEHESDNAGSDV